MIRTGKLTGKLTV